MGWKKFFGCCVAQPENKEADLVTDMPPKIKESKKHEKRMNLFQRKAKADCVSETNASKPSTFITRLAACFFGKY